MKIGALQKFSLIDYPNEICAIIFTVGCNFRCPYCHNPELVTGSTNGIEEKELFEFLKKRTGRLTAVSITGGEPTIHKDLPVVIKKIKELGYKVKLDTNGTNPDAIDELIGFSLIDYIAMDIKAPFEKYDRVTNVKCKIDDIRRSIDIIKKSNINYEFRTTVVEGLLSKEDVLKIAKSIKGAKAYFIQRFIPSKTLNKAYMNKSSITNDELDEIKKDVSMYFDRFGIR